VADGEIFPVKISVVIPFYNAKETLKGCLDSLLSQTYPKHLFEIIFVDDGSTDGSAESIKPSLREALKNGFKIKLIRLSKRGGPAAARNQGIKQSMGDIIAFTDADCTPDRKWLENLARSFSKEEIGGVFGETKTSSKDILIWPLVLAPTSSSFRYTTCNIAYSKSVLSKVGFFDENFKEPFREDTDLALSVIENGFQIAYNPKAIIHHPARILSVSRILRTAFRYHYDNLLYKKHNKSVSSELSRFLAPYLGPFSPIGLFFLSASVLLVAGFILNFILTLELSLIFAACYFIFFVAYGYTFVLLEKFSAPLSMRAKCAVILPIFVIVLIIARIYGSFKFKKLLI